MSIEVLCYENGYEVKGHSVSEQTCTEVSLLAWVFACLLDDYCGGSGYYTSSLHNDSNPSEGYTCVTANEPERLAAAELLAAFERYAKVCNDVSWGDVSIESAGGSLVQRKKEDA